MKGSSLPTANNPIKHNRSKFQDKKTIFITISKAIECPLCLDNEEKKNYDRQKRNHFFLIFLTLVWIISLLDVKGSKIISWPDPLPTTNTLSTQATMEISVRCVSSSMVTLEQKSWWRRMEEFCWEMAKNCPVLSHSKYWHTLS